MSKFVVCAYRPWNVSMCIFRLSEIYPDCILISSKEALTIERLRKINPELVFFLDWSWIVKQDILDEFKCVGFHTAPLPMYRGGSPIQNQIIRGEIQTKLTAFMMDGGIDTGDILLQRDMSLMGSISNILKMITNLEYHMIDDIVKGKYTVTPQHGKGSYYKRRKPSESELQVEDFNREMQYLYNFARMLEDPYPNAFIKLGNKKIIFKSVEKKDNKIQAQIEIEDLDEQDTSGSGTP